MGDVQVSYKYRIPRACIAFFLGGLNCSIRFTCLAAFVPMGVLLSLRKSQQVSMSAILSYLIGVCGTFGFLGIFVTFLFDYALYGFPAVPILGNIDFNVIKGELKESPISCPLASFLTVWLGSRKWKVVWNASVPLVSDSRSPRH